MRIITLIGISFVLFLQSSAQTGFTEVSQQVGISHFTFNPMQMGAAAAWFDYDGDTDDDCYITGAHGVNALYRNNGDGTFTDVTAGSGIVLPVDPGTQGVVTGDIDNDGDRDLYISTQWWEPNYFFLNNGDGTFTDHSIASGLGVDSVWVSSATFGDFDLDGFLDLYTGNYVWRGQGLYDSLGQPIGYAHRCSTNTLWHNNGDGTFTDVTAAMMVGDTGCALSVVFTDYDLDHDQDIMVSNDFGQWVLPNGLYNNQYPAAYSDVSVSSGINTPMYGMGIATGDYDHDLDLDYYMTNIGYNTFYQNQGNGTFAEIAGALGVANDTVNGLLAVSWGCAFLDYDNDRWQDLAVANGFIQLLSFIQNDTVDYNVLYHNDGMGGFTDTSVPMGFTDSSSHRGLAYADYDDDGDLDLLLPVIRTDTPSTAHTLLYRNDLNNGNHWLKVRVQGTTNNRDGFGTILRISVGGDSWLHEVQSGASHMSQHTSTAHFGLGTATTVDSLLVIWPDGNLQLQTGLPVDTTLLIVEDSSQFLAVTPPAGPLKILAFPNPFANGLTLQIETEMPQALRLEVRDAMGRLIDVRDDISMQKGENRLQWGNQRSTTAGVYFFTLIGEGFRQTIQAVHRP